jgi:hypothetical protein
MKRSKLQARSQIAEAKNAEIPIRMMPTELISSM